MALLILATIFLSGCSRQDSASAGGSQPKTDSQGWVSLSSVSSALQFAKDKHYELMAQILADGKVSRDEYTESFDSWSSCMEKAGTVFSMPSPIWNPTSNQELIRAWTVNPPADTEREQAVCWNQYNFIKQEFQVQTAPHTDPQLMTYVIGCIQREGGPKNLTPAVDLQKLSLESPDIADSNPNSPISSCVSDGITSLYPGLQGYSLSF